MEVLKLAASNVLGATPTITLAVGKLGYAASVLNISNPENMSKTTQI